MQAIPAIGHVLIKPADAVRLVAASQLPTPGGRWRILVVSVTLIRSSVFGRAWWPALRATGVRLSLIVFLAW